LRKRVALLGATGSIGGSALSVLDNLQEDFELFAVSAHRNASRLLEIRRQHPYRYAILTDPEATVPDLDVEVLRGKEGLIEIAAHPEVDIVLVATGGIIGVFPALAGLREGKRVALANKETLVSFGEVVTEELRRSKGELIPVDSEHSALFQLVEGRTDEIRSLVLTSSGGPFRTLRIEEMERLSAEDALKHPTWSMGKKITVDSATLMNKGLEVIEARWLFGRGPDEIQVLIHPQSIVHGLVELADGSFLAHLGYPDMRIPIQFALTYPERCPSPVKTLSLPDAGTLEFSEPDLDRFPCLKLAYEALRTGGTVPCAMNAANEVAVDRFLGGRIGFNDIYRVVETVLGAHEKAEPADLGTLLEVDAWARREAESTVRRGEKSS
jgi:1-deoxy-D-xylulose-5-phosphate reductoisomerase